MQAKLDKICIRIHAFYVNVTMEQPLHLYGNSGMNSTLLRVDVGCDAGLALTAHVY